MFAVEFITRPMLEPSERMDGFMRFVKAFEIRYRGAVYTVPEGFETDGASIPDLLTIFCGSKYRAPRVYAAFLHDFNYSGGDPEVDRAEADDLYRDMQIALGIPRWKAYLEWRVLRLFGWTHWQGRKDASERGAFIALLCAIGTVAATAALFVLCGCIEIANVESFVTVPRDAVSFGVQNQKGNNP